MANISRRSALLAAASLWWAIACTPQTPPSTSSNPSPTAASTTSPNSSPNASPLKLGIGIWPGFAGGYVAIAKDLYRQQNVTIEEVRFSELSTGITAFLAKKTDILWGTSADAVQIIQQDPSIKIIYLTDYSNGGDGVVGRNINSAADIKGKTIGRENLLYVNVLLRAFLQKNGLTEQDVILKDLLAPDAAAAFSAKRLDLVVSYEPWMTKAAQTGGGKILFTSKGTNLLADVILVREPLLAERRQDLIGFIRAIDAGMKLVRTGDAEALKIVGDRLGVTVEETKAQLATVLFFDIAENKTVVFNAADNYSLLKNLEFMVQVAYDTKVIPKLPDIRSLYDDSIVRSL